ncbi:ATP-binding protein [Paenibacillus sp. JSM ZJ436]|uniref:ATP-binding protein n=1 Tax=Paenibacillus sp. JSM ZJ436 TaxID=3376190 RepID=UPI0037A39649
MLNNEKVFGKIVKIEGIHVLIEITEKDIANKISLFMGSGDFAVSINKLLFSVLPSGKKVVGRITKIFDRNMFDQNSIFINASDRFLIEADLIGIHDDYLKKFDSGINHYPIIGSEVYAVNERIQKAVLDIGSKWRIEVGKSFNDPNISISANPDILFGKHLGVFGNTGTGKTCTLASIIQGIKRRIYKNIDGSKSEISPKIIIFDSNSEYDRAFSREEFKVRIITKNELKLPHYHLNFSEYYKFLGASQGVQAPVLKASIKQLRVRENDGKKFKLSDVPTEIKKYLMDQAVKGADNERNKTFSFSQWYGWNATMINRIERLIEDEDLISMIETDLNTVEEILQSDDEVILIQADFNKDELDIVMFLFSKLIYEWSIKNRDNQKKNHVLILFEEAHRYINEDDAEEYKLGSFYIERLAREGRKFGISLIISSQRPSELSTTVVSQCNSFIVHRITNKRDFDVINKILSTNNQNLLSIIPGLEKQYAIVVGEAFGYSDVIKLFDANPTPKSDDPEVISNWNYTTKDIGDVQVGLDNESALDEFIREIIDHTQTKSIDSNDDLE